MTDVRRRTYAAVAGVSAFFALALATLLVLAPRTAGAADSAAMMSRASCNAQCSRALARLIGQLFRFLIQHFGWGWGITGLLALVAAAVGVQLWLGDDQS